MKRNRRAVERLDSALGQYVDERVDIRLEEHFAKIEDGVLALIDRHLGGPRRRQASPHLDEPSEEEEESEAEEEQEEGETARRTGSRGTKEEEHPRDKGKERERVIPRQTEGQGSSSAPRKRARKAAGPPRSHQIPERVTGYYETLDHSQDSEREFLDLIPQQPDKVFISDYTLHRNGSHVRHYEDVLPYLRDQVPLRCECPGNLTCFFDRYEDKETGALVPFLACGKKHSLAWVKPGKNGCKYYSSIFEGLPDGFEYKPSEQEKKKPAYQAILKAREDKKGKPRARRGSK